MNTQKKSNQSSGSRLSPLVFALAFVAVTAAWFGMRPTGAEVKEIIVYKTPTCGCCVKWVDHLRDNGFEVNAVDVPSTQRAREKFGVPGRLASCHTAKVGDYWVEGHVPADLIQRLLKEMPDDIHGISVPGMPIGSPGMEGPDPVTYDVLAWGSDERVTVYATRAGKQSP